MYIKNPQSSTEDSLDCYSSASHSNSFQATRKKSVMKVAEQPQTSCSNAHLQLSSHKNRSSTFETSHSKSWLCKITTLALFLTQMSVLSMAQTTQSQVSTKSRCYSCASENMKENFLSRSRGPKRRKEEPKLYDNMCDLDTWMIREKSAVECDGSCFKWQQVLNNSGVYSYATIRGCYNKMLQMCVGMHRSRRRYEDWMMHGEKQVTAGGNPRAPPMAVYLQWIVDAWDSLPKELIEKSFKGCGITNATDKSEDYKIHCFKEDGPVPGGRIKLHQAREDKEMADLFEEIDFEEDQDNIEYDIDVSLEC